MQNRSVVIGLGSNKNAIPNLRRALLLLRQQKQFKIFKVSRIYESKALLPDMASPDWNQDYLNAAVLVQVNQFEPNDLLRTLKNIEKQMGRQASERWAPREIDLDILYVENFEYKSENLNIPHMELNKRPFAFLPAQEVCSKIRFDHITTGTWLSQKYFWSEFAAILNITPDSISDGGKYNQKELLLLQAQKLLDQGADYLDIGAESTRPGAEAISHDEEIKRLTMAFEALSELKCPFKISLDSRNFEVIRYICDKYPVDLINDVSGFKDSRLIEYVNNRNLKAVCMHSLSVPADKNQVLSADVDLVQEIQNWWLAKIKKIKNSENIYFDPGFGFGKTAQQSQFLFDHIDQFNQIKNPFFLGYSRKSFLKGEDKDQETAELTKKLNVSFAQVLRFHELTMQKEALLRSHEL